MNGQCAVGTVQADLNTLGNEIQKMYEAKRLTVQERESQDGEHREMVASGKVAG